MLAAAISTLIALEGLGVWRFCMLQARPYERAPVPSPDVIRGILATTNSDVKGLT